MAKGDTEKRCSRCRLVKPASEFGKRSKGKGPQSHCRLCAKAGMLLRLYGLSLDQYYGMLVDQAGRCAICGNGFCESVPAYVDHCHQTGVVRGLLCRACNSALGNFRDSKTNLLKAVDYLNERQPE